MDKISVLSISYGRNLFQEHNPERERLRVSSAEVAVHHMIVFSLRSHGLVETNVDDHFVLHPTNSAFRGAMIIDALWLGRRILFARKKGERWCISAQDPFATGVVGIALRWMTHIPLLVQEHGDVYFGSYWKNETHANRIWYSLGKHILRRADRVRAVSVRVREHLTEIGVKEEHTVLLPVFTDTHALEESAVRTDLRKLHPHASCIILSVARFVSQKNLILLLRAFAHVYQKDGHAHLVLVGKGPLEGALQKECRQLGIEHAVDIVPWTDDVASYMKTADIYALSSNYEGWARVLIEAMAVGLPSVTTEVGCVGEVFKDGIHGRVVPVGDEKAFADALVSLAQDRITRVKMGHMGRVDAERTILDGHTYARQWAELYRF